MARATSSAFAAGNSAMTSSGSAGLRLRTKRFALGWNHLPSINEPVFMVTSRRQDHVLERRSPRQITHGVTPSLFEFVDLFRRPPLFGIPTLETIFLGWVAVLIFFEHFLAAGTENKIRQQQGGVGMRCLGQHCRGAGVGWHDVHRDPFDRRAGFERYFDMIAKSGGRDADFAGDHHVEQRASGYVMHGGA